MVQFLAESGANLNAADFRGINLLIAAAMNGHRETVECLAKLDADTSQLSQLP